MKSPLPKIIHSRSPYEAIYSVLGTKGGRYGEEEVDSGGYQASGGIDEEGEGSGDVYVGLCAGAQGRQRYYRTAGSIGDHSVEAAEEEVVPYRSEKQRRYLHAKHPEIAARWDKKYGGKVVKGKKKKRAR